MAGGSGSGAANFLHMAVAFSINHAAVTSVLGLATGLLGDNGTYQSGTLFLLYAITAMIFSSGLIETFGARSTLIAAASLYTVYVLSFPLVLVVSSPALEILFALFGGAVGGVAAGVLWPAQGVYFSLSARQYAAHCGAPVGEANGTLASMFAVSYLATEVVLKLLPVAFLPIRGSWVLYEDGSGDEGSGVAACDDHAKCLNARDLLTVRAARHSPDAASRRSTSASILRPPLLAPYHCSYTPGCSSILTL